MFKPVTSPTPYRHTSSLLRGVRRIRLVVLATGTLTAAYQQLFGQEDRGQLTAA
jgi:hypothetical protein